jgi:pentatricopeptide repeat protein
MMLRKSLSSVSVVRPVMAYTVNNRSFAKESVATNDKQALFASLRNATPDQVLKSADTILADPTLKERDFTLLMAVVGRAGHWQRTLDLIADMEKRGMTPNPLSYHAAVSACANAKQWQKAISTMDALSSSGFIGGTATYNAALGACDQGKQGKKAIAYVADMRAAGVALDADTYKLAISAAEKGGDKAGADALKASM